MLGRKKGSIVRRKNKLRKWETKWEQQGEAMFTEHGR